MPGLTNVLVVLATALGAPREGLPLPPPSPGAPADGVAADGFPGTLVYRPAGPPRAAVVVLHGSEGGRAPFAPWLASALAERGAVTAAFCWFGCEGLPDGIRRVSLDRTVDFLRWFEAGPAKDLPVVLYGASRGAEQALLLGSLLGVDPDGPHVDGIAAHAGTDTLVAGFDPARGLPYPAEGGYDAAWTWHGAPLYGERALPFGSGPRIAIEQYLGPVWLSHGERDPLWPVARTLALAKARADLPTEVHVWPGEGHVVTSPEHAAAFLASLGAFVEARAGVAPAP